MNLDDVNKCEVCETTENLRIVPLMTGDSLGKRLVCMDCYIAWYDGAQTKDEILKARGINP